MSCSASTVRPCTYAHCKCLVGVLWPACTGRACGMPLPGTVSGLVVRAHTTSSWPTNSANSHCQLAIHPNYHRHQEQPLVQAHIQVLEGAACHCEIWRYMCRAARSNSEFGQNIQLSTSNTTTSSHKLQLNYHEMSFFLEYAREMCIFVLRRKRISQSTRPVRRPVGRKERDLKLPVGYPPR
jgi:hypothetical protein